MKDIQHQEIQDATKYTNKSHIMHIYHFAPPNKKHTNNKHIIKLGGFSPTSLNKQNVASRQIG